MYCAAEERGPAGSQYRLVRCPGSICFQRCDFHWFSERCSCTSALCSSTIFIPSRHSEFFFLKSSICAKINLLRSNWPETSPLEFSSYTNSEIAACNAVVPNCLTTNESRWFSQETSMQPSQQTTKSSTGRRLRLVASVGVTGWIKFPVWVNWDNCSQLQPLLGTKNSWAETENYVSTYYVRKNFTPG